MNTLPSTTSEEIWRQFSLALTNEGIECHFLFSENFDLLSIKNKAIIIHLVSINNNFMASDLMELQTRYQAKNIKLIHLWEDVWQSKPTQVLARIKSLMGLNIRIHGRKTIVKKLDKQIADSFLSENHIQGAVNSRHKFGLYLNEKLMAVATFSALRKMRHSDNYKSAELIRFAVKAGYSINGGLSKLISSFQKTYQPNDLMTYADRDWSAGEAYLKLGFENTDVLEPKFFDIDEDYNRKLSDSNSEKNVFNTGSLKYILKF
ncbi:hypothetical protein [Pedobacter mucosus]|uniref:hypothetical protein n=1 Tax=Pedobacter mucosus TaxID=2895286 RepID=UPI001EE3BC36|nr:hypothetical protein [Pedobacter mucosus]UKT65308.1 hypothetical protein LOK61_05880 [Pedobacter mucosus]